MFALDEQVLQVVRNANRTGIDLQKCIDSGNVRVQYTSAGSAGAPIRLNPAFYTLGTVMQQQDIERVVRGLLDDLGVNVTLLLVEPATAAWRVVLKTEGGPMDIILPDGPAVTVRARLQHYIESDLP